MLEFLKKLLVKSPAQVLGALLDTRSLQEKDSDIKFEELVAEAENVEWVEKNSLEYRIFPAYSQGQASNCVACTKAKMQGIHFFLKFGEFIQFSAGHIYKRRKNKPNAGMLATDAFSIAQEGVTLEVLAPTPKNDVAIDAMKIEEYKVKVGEVFKSGRPIILPIKDIETVASVIQKTKKAVMVWFYFTDSEWARKVPAIENYGLQVNVPSTLRHSVTAVDFTLYNGKKALIIEDSAWFGGINQRIITEEFYSARNFFAGYTMSFQFDEIYIKKPRYTGSVASLQDCLRAEGVFPANVESTGILGVITKKAISDFQGKWGIERTGSVGPVTGDKLKTLYP